MAGAGLAGCQMLEQEFPTPAACELQQAIKEDHSYAAELTTLLDSFVQAGLPGAVIAVSNEEGDWAGAAGLASIEEEIPMRACMAQHGFSISKTMFSALCMRLWDQGLIGLDAPIADYLPGDIAEQVADHEKITVRMLLNHTSGIPEFHEDLGRISEYLQEPVKRRSREELLGYISKKPLLFEPGTDWAYSNTNYLLLTWVIEDAAGKDHALAMKEQLLDPLGLSHTWYKVQPGYPDALALPNYYWDRYSNGILENCSEANLNIGAWSGYGEDGVIATPLDFVHFMQALAGGEVVSEAAWAEMTQWVQGSQSTEPDYGLGLVWVNFGGGVHEFGHYGGGVGGVCVLIYLPEQKTSVYVATNAGTITGGEYAHLAYTFINRIPAVLAEM